MNVQSVKFEPYWLEEDDWLVTLAMVDLNDEEDRADCGERIGYLVAYAYLTNTRYLALVGDPEMVTYELLFSFESAENKCQFLALVNGNEVTRVDPEEWMVPEPEEIRKARPLAQVIPEDILMLAELIAASIMALE